MTHNEIDGTAYDFPPGMSQPALRALLEAGYTSLEHLTAITAADALALHGMGPKGIRLLREATTLPLAAYQVSGEYAMLKAAAERGWLDEKRVVLESLTSIRRAGADAILTYYARQAAEWLG